MYKTGIIGDGPILDTYCTIISQSRNFQLQGILSDHKSNIKSLETAKDYTEVETIIQDCDLIVILTCDQQFNFAQKVLKASKNLLLHNAFRFTSFQLRNLSMLADESKAKCFVNHPKLSRNLSLIHKFNPTESAFIQVEDNQNFSNLIFETLANDLLIYDLDLVFRLVNRPLRKLNSHFFKIVHQMVDHLNVNIQFDNGSVADIVVSTIALKEEDCKVGITQRSHVAEYHFKHLNTENEQSVKDALYQISNSYQQQDYNIHDAISAIDISQKILEQMIYINTKQV